MYHPDFYNNPSLIEDDELRFEFVSQRQIGKMRELIEIKPGNIDMAPWMEAETKKRLNPTLEQYGGKKWVDKFYKLLSYYNDKGMLPLKLVITGETLESFRRDPGARVLKLNDSFLKALKKTTIKDLTAMIDRPFNLYVSFEKSQRQEWDSKSVVGKGAGEQVVYDDLTGCYMSYVPPEADLPATIALLYTCSTESSTAQLSTGLIVPIHRGKSFRECFLEAKNDKNSMDNPINAAAGIDIQSSVLKSFEDSFDLANAVLNACIYYFSLEPDVRHLEPERQKKKANEYARKKGVATDDISAHYPVTLINWAYGRDRTYSVDSTWVESFLRWQRCGPGFSQVKLTLVKEHERTYSKGVADERIHSEQVAN